MAVSSSSSWVQSCCSFDHRQFPFIDSSSGLKSRAKFENFDGVAPWKSPDELSTASLNRQTAVEDVEEDDSCLPSDLEGAVRQLGEACLPEG